MVDQCGDVARAAPDKIGRQTMAVEQAVARHYTHGGLANAILTALAAAG